MLLLMNPSGVSSDSRPTTPSCRQSHRRAHSSHSASSDGARPGLGIWRSLFRDDHTQLASVPRSHSTSAAEDDNIDADMWDKVRSMFFHWHESDLVRHESWSRKKKERKQCTHSYFASGQNDNAFYQDVVSKPNRLPLSAGPSTSMGTLSVPSSNHGSPQSSSGSSSFSTLSIVSSQHTISPTQKHPPTSTLRSKLSMNSFAFAKDTCQPPSVSPIPDGAAPRRQRKPSNLPGMQGRRLFKAVSINTLKDVYHFNKPSVPRPRRDSPGRAEVAEALPSPSDRAEPLEDFSPIYAHPTEPLPEPAQEDHSIPVRTWREKTSTSSSQVDDGATAPSVRDTSAQRHWPQDTYPKTTAIPSRFHTCPCDPLPTIPQHPTRPSQERHQMEQAVTGVPQLNLPPRSVDSKTIRKPASLTALRSVKTPIFPTPPPRSRRPLSPPSRTTASKAGSMERRGRPDGRTALEPGKPSPTSPTRAAAAPSDTLPSPMVRSRSDGPLLPATPPTIPKRGRELSNTYTAGELSRLKALTVPTDSHSAAPRPSRGAMSLGRTHEEHIDEVMLKLGLAPVGPETSAARGWGGLSHRAASPRSKYAGMVPHGSTDIDALAARLPNPPRHPTKLRSDLAAPSGTGSSPPRPAAARPGAPPREGAEPITSHADSG